MLCPLVLAGFTVERRICSSSLLDSTLQLRNSRCVCANCHNHHLFCQKQVFFISPWLIKPKQLAFDKSPIYPSNGTSMKRAAIHPDSSEPRRCSALPRTARCNISLQVCDTRQSHLEHLWYLLVQVLHAKTVNINAKDPTSRIWD